MVIRIPNLKIIKFFFVSILIFNVSCSGKSVQKHSAADDIRAIEQMSADRAEAFRNGDAEGIAAHFTEDGILMAPGSPTQQGQDAVRDYYQSIFDDFDTDLNSYYDEVEVSGDLAYGRGFAEVVLVPHGGGDAVEATSKYINILKRQADGTWKTTHDIWNDNE